VTTCGRSCADEATLAEIAENLHRADLTVEERSGIRRSGSSLRKSRERNLRAVEETMAVEARTRASVPLYVRA
jgi:hypothetical protein